MAYRKSARSGRRSHVATVLVAVAVALALTLEHVPAECREAVREILSGS